MGEMKQAVGTLVGITEKASGWTTVEVDQGSKYTLKLDTKRESIIDEARTFRGGTLALWTYTESESDKINDHTGKPFINRYLESVENAPEGAHKNAASSASSNEDRMTKEEWEAKDRAIHKMACIKAAARALTHTVPAEPSDQDLNLFIERVTHLSSAWLRQVVAERAGDDDIPF